MSSAASAESPYRTILLDTVGSTNEEGLDRARRGETGPLWIRSRVQTRGRGRIGRNWVSPRGNLHTSLMLSDPAEVRHAPQLGFVAGVALALAVRGLPGIDDHVRLKWPNDLVHQGAKLAGILVEGCHGPDGTFACVVGFGVNCASHPSGLDYPATDLGALTGEAHLVEDLSRRLHAEMARALDLWDRGRRFDAVRDAWLSLALPRGTPLAVKSASGTTHGAFDTIDPAGRLRMSTPDGVRTVDAADVFPSGPPPHD